MSELLVDYITSLDGYGAAEGWPGFWGMESPEYLAWLGEQPEHIHLMGANTYRLMHGFAAQGEPGTDVMADFRKVVFSSTLSEPLEWANSTLVSTDPVEAVREMKAHETMPIATLGSLTLCRSLLAAGLVDRFRVVVFPVITGATGQERIYDGYPDVALDLVESRTFEGGLQLLTYQPRVLDGPPSTGA
ncbi:MULTISPECIES: dihydrofolate reductase family protein [unclassified Nocardioides]|uniref:dihydrofolate reductase family protein n=1 Tax=unclassified Nocardioides TaxID=2615069 RepID=UPI0006F99F39|nr:MULTISPECIES: dihydrofolate reductase family protein [unclassified Nocardioides]KQY57313.1 deaminase [Nocardioides sp. Root140]KQZ68827.1 deaminase [Nocardioides sp. Root151]KRF11956.1 deaminase [Nocardioides sp. Soil796]